MLTDLPRARQLAPGLVAWEAHHPAWGRDVTSVAFDAGRSVVLIDPLAPPALGDARRFWKALDRAATGRRIDVIVTLHYHRRSADAVRSRYRRRCSEAAVWVPVESAPRIGTQVDRAFTAGDALPAGVEAFATDRADEVVLWLPGPRAIVSGDVLLGGVRRPYRVCPPSWLPRTVTRAEVAAALAPLRGLPVELLVPTHGPPVTTNARAVLAAALDEAAS